MARVVVLASQRPHPPPSLLKMALTMETVQKILFYYIVYKYTTRLYRHVRATGIIQSGRDLYARAMVAVFSVLMRLPSSQKKIKTEMAAARRDMQEKLADWITTQFDEFDKMHATDWAKGRVSGAVYYGEPGEKVDQAMKQAVVKYILSNPLHPDVFPGVRKMESEMIAMVLGMFNASPSGAGATTSGGTESILMACKAHKEWARETKGITEPEIVASVSAHAAFEKAANYFGIILRKIPVDPKTRKVNLAHVKRAINKNTIMLVGSAPNFPDGIIDDIPALGALARKFRTGLHVDCCLGSFLVPFLAEAGYETEPFDFRVPGVTSISCDPHKYGFAPKGVSVVLYHTAELRRFQYFVTTTWPGGVYASPTIAGSRPGSLVAGAWATMMVQGRQGYIDSCREIVGAAKKIEAGIRAKVPEVEILGKPLVSVVAFSSDVVNILEVGDRMSKKGWHLNALQYPAALHICCTRLTIKAVDDFVNDVQSVVKDVLANPGDSKGNNTVIYGLGNSSAAGPALVKEVASMYIDTLSYALPSS